MLRELAGGRIFFDRLPTISAFTTDRSRVNAPRGDLIQVDSEILGAAIDGATSLKRGQFYAELEYQTGNRFSEICRGYQYNGFIPSLGDRIESGPGGGEGNFRTVTGANPAAGAEASDAVPAGALWKLLAYSIVLVTDGTGANRIVNLVADDGAVTNRYGLIYGGATAHTATLTRTHMFKDGSDNQGDDNLSFADTQTMLLRSKPLFKNMLLPGDVLRTNTTAMVAGDDYAAPIFMVEEWLTL